MEVGVKTVDQLKQEIHAVETAMEPMRRRLDSLERDLRHAESRQWIAINKVTKSDVELANDKQKPWFVTVYDFATWLTSVDCQKPFCEFNGRIYFTSEIKAHRMALNAPGFVNDLSE